MRFVSLSDNFLPTDYDLNTNLFDDEFMLEQFVNTDDITEVDDLAIRGIKEELESWAGSSSASSSPTFSHQNVSPSSDSDEEKCLAKASFNPYDFLRDVVVLDPTNDTENRDTPSPGSTSSSSGCFSDFSCTTNENNSNIGPGIVQTQVQPIQISTPQKSQHTAINAAPKPIRIRPKSQAEEIVASKTVILSPEDFGQLMRTMQTTKAAPTIHTIVRPLPTPLGVVKPRPVAAQTVKPAVIEPILCLPNQVIDERTFKKQQRLIRNRESANLSRKKKKDFVDSLEEALQQLGVERDTLVNVSGRDGEKMRIYLEMGSIMSDLIDYYRRTTN